MSRYVIGLDIGGTNIRIASQEEGSSVENFIKVSRVSVLDGSPDQMKKLADFIKEYVKSYHSDTLPEAIALGFPAAIDKTRSIVLQAPNIEGLDGTNVKAELEKYLNIPVYVERDTNILFLCDMDDLGIEVNGIGIGVYVGTGIGNAIFIGNEPLIGKNGVAGEIGHIPTQGSTKQCGCGNYGCSECYGSGWRLVEINKEYFPETDISDLFTKHSDTQVLRDFVDYIACTVDAEVNTLDPDCVVLGGGIINMNDFPKALLEEKIHEHARKPFPSENLQIYYSKDGAENGARGACKLAWNKVNK